MGLCRVESGRENKMLMPTTLVQPRPKAKTIAGGVSLAIVLATAAIIVGCTTARNTPDRTAELINVPIQFTGVNGGEMPVDDRPVKWTAVLGAVPGGIFGAPNYPPPIAKDLGKATTVPIHLTALRDALDTQAATIAAAAAKAGWKIEPADTRFARLATTIVTADKARGPFWVGFVDSASKNKLLLVFFDRPCRLTGTVAIHENGTTTYTVDVSIEKPGLNWLAITSSGSDRRLTNAELPSRLIFLVASHASPLKARMGSDQADTPETRMAAAKRYYSTVDSKKLLDQSFRAGVASLPEDKRAEALALAKAHFHVEDLTAVAIEALVKNFSTDELNAMADFYGSAEGQSILAKYPTYLAEVMPAMLAEVKRAIAEIQTELQSNREARKTGT
jgi:hypothetical protein